jgi:hypothetical protein
MRKLFLSLGCALALLTTATVSDASIFVKISDGTVANDLDGRTLGTKGGLILAKLSPLPAGTLDVTDTLTVLSCTTRPCTVHFPSGNTAPTAALATDTFTLQDVSATSLARVEKFDSGASADRVSLKGLKITSRVAGKVLTLTYGIQAGDLRVLTSTQATSYAATAALSGSFKTSTGLRATACKAGTVSTDMDDASDSCVRLSLAINGATVDGQGNTVSATVSVPCNSAFPTLNPCGTNGIWTGSVGTFTGVNDSKSISCPSACSPVQVGTLVAKFNGANEVLQLTASTHGALANVTDENGGVEETALALATEIGANRWVTFSAAVERCRAEPKAPAINSTRNINDQSGIPISFEYWCGSYAPAGAAGVPLVSLVDSVRLPGAAGTRYDASRVAFLPAAGQLQLKNVNTLGFAYDVFAGTETNPLDSRLGLLTYSDCKGGSLRVEIQLVDSNGVNLGVIKVYLGSNPGDNFKSLCDGFESIGADIVNNPDARVDLSGLTGNLSSPCCTTFVKAKGGQLGKYLVRKIAFIVSPASPPADPAENYKTTFLDGNVNGFPAQSSLQVVADVTRTFDLSTNGVSIVITKLTSPSASGLGVVKVVRSTDIVINGGKFTTNVSVNDIQPESGAQYGISLCPNGAETDFAPSGPDPELTPPGICIANQATMGLL